LLKPRITQPPRGFFDGFGRLARFEIGTGFGRGIDASLVKGQAELRCKIVYEFEVAVSLRPAQAVMQVRDVQDEAQFPAPFDQRV
jgi:hypothetical protein